MRNLYRRAIFRSPYRNGIRLLVLILVAVTVAVRLWMDSDQTVAPETLDETAYHVKRVVDGDTLLLTNHARIRLIGVDTPETVRPDHPVEPWGPEASEFTKRFVDKGKVRLQFDRERVDDYGRFLAYVWVDGQMLNEELIRAGLGRAVTWFPYSDSMKKRFLRAQKEAKQAGRGRWSKPQ